jgi:hypothetical protein
MILCVGGGWNNKYQPGDSMDWMGCDVENGVLEWGIF